jgi:hypothetical protein
LQAFYCQPDIIDALNRVIDDAATHNTAAANLSLARISGRTPRAAGRLLF